MKRRLFFAYLILLHLFVGLVLAKSNFIPLVKNKIELITTNYLTISKAEAKIPKFKAITSVVLSYHIGMDDNVPEGAVIFIGDSTIQRLCVSAVFPLLVNYGISGDTSAGVLKRLPEYKSLERASVVVIAVGINDMWGCSNKDILKNYQKIIQCLPEKLPILFSAVLPVDENGGKFGQGINQRISRLNEKLKILCASSTRLFFVDAGPILTDKDGNLSDEFHDVDNIHLNSMGNKIWINELKKTIMNVQQTYAKKGGSVMLHLQQ